MSANLSPYDLRMMRDTQEAHHPDVVAILRLVRAVDGKGGFTTGTPTTIYAERACTITPGVQVEKGGQADRGLEVEMWTVTFPWGTDVQDGDVLDWAAEGIELQVVDAKVSKSRGTAVRIMADKVKGDPWL